MAQHTDTIKKFTWKSLLFRLVGVPFLSVLALFIMIKLGPNFQLLRCWSLDEQGHCVIHTFPSDWVNQGDE